MDYRSRFSSSAGSYQTSRAPPPASPTPGRDASPNRALMEREILEQEIRRDLELGRSMAMRFRGAPMYADPLPIKSTPHPSTPWTRHSEFGLDDRMQLPAPSRLDATVAESLPLPQLRRYLDAEFTERTPLPQPQLHHGPVYTGRLPMLQPLHGDAGFTERTQMPQLLRGPDAGITEPPPPQLQLHRGMDAGFTERLPIRPPSQTLLPIQPPSQTLLRGNPAVPHSETAIRNGQLPSNRENKGETVRSGEKRKAERGAEAEDVEQPAAEKQREVTAGTELGWITHLQGKRHKRMKAKPEYDIKNLALEDQQKIAAQKLPVHCDVCQAKCFTMDTVFAHFGSRKHKDKVLSRRAKLVEDNVVLSGPQKDYMVVATEGHEKKRCPEKQFEGSSKRPNSQVQNPAPSTSMLQAMPDKVCDKCGRHGHLGEKCRGRIDLCRFCGQIGHYAKKCRVKKRAFNNGRKPEQ